MSGVSRCARIWICCCAVWAFATASAFPQSVTSLGANTATADEFQRLRFLDFITSRGGTDPTGQVDAPSNTVPGIYVKATAQSLLSKYTFPVAVGFNPFQRIANPNTNPLANAIAGSVLEAAYTPLTLVQEPRATNPSSNHVVGHSSQAVTASYSIEMKNLNALYVLDGQLRRGDRAVADATEAWMEALRDLSITGTASYTATWDDTKQNQLNGVVKATKALPATIVGSRVVAIEGSGGVAVFPAKQNLGGYYGVTPTVAARAALSPDVQVRVQFAASHYYGDGFHGIDGVFDHTLRTDYNLAEVLTFMLKGDQPLLFTVKEVHIGSGSADVAVTTEFSFKFTDFKVPIAVR